ncbi:MAG TPA: M67 family peptidase [Nitrospirae bacterium]|nr:M67 family peptidase [Nitrospirota bacterium]
MSALKLRPEDLEIMYAHAADQFPNESCGVVLGKADEPEKTEVRRLTNIQRQLNKLYPDLYQRDADTGYFADPKELIRVFKDAASGGLEVIGFYHSHPNHDAYWSIEDHKAAMWAGTDEPSFPDAFHVVISVYDGVVKGAAMFRWDAKSKSFTESSIE